MKINFEYFKHINKSEESTSIKKIKLKKMKMQS